MDYNLLEDNELCSRIEETKSFIELQRRYLWLIRQKANKYSDSSNIDDCVQEGLLALYNAAKNYDPQMNTSFRTYAGICIKNRIINESLRNSRQNNYLQSSLVIDEEQSTVSLEEEIELKEDFEAVLNQIHITLSEFEKKILAIYLSGSERSEIPVKYGIPIKAYDNAVQRFRKKLKNTVFKV